MNRITAIAVAVGIFLAGTSILFGIYLIRRDFPAQAEQQVEIRAAQARAAMPTEPTPSYPIRRSFNISRNGPPLEIPVKPWENFCGDVDQRDVEVELFVDHQGPGYLMPTKESGLSRSPAMGTGSSVTVCITKHSPSGTGTFTYTLTHK